MVIASSPVKRWFGQELVQRRSGSVTQSFNHSETHSLHWFLASILLQYSKALTHLSLSATSCIHAVSIFRFLPLVSPQFLACIVIWVQYLCVHRV